MSSGSKLSGAIWSGVGLGVLVRVMVGDTVVSGRVVGVRDGVGVAVGLGVNVGPTVMPLAWVGVAVRVKDGVDVVVPVAVKDGVGVAVPVGVGLRVGDGVGVQVGGRVGTARVWDRWLFCSLLSATSLRASTMAVLVPTL